MGLSWTTPADNGSAIIRYEYRVREDGETSWDPDWTEVADSDASTTSYTVGDLTNGTAYTFEVRAVNSSGAGTSAQVRAVPGTAPALGVGGCADGFFVGNPGINTGLVSDCEALVAIRNHWTEDSGNADLPSTHPLRTWGLGESAAISEWEGVTVSNQRVTGLDLHAVNDESKISGTLPAELGDLSRLDQLYLFNNGLTGEIPGELGDLSRLDQLYLFNNGLTGEIPGELGDLTSLTQLYLNDNGLTGEIPVELGDLSSLERLYLYNNELTGEIPQELGDFSSLSVLNLSGNLLTGSIPEELGDLTRLRSLYLSGNELRGGIPEELGDLSSLSALHLSGNLLTGPIPVELGDLSNVLVLNLSGNRLSGPIPEELGDLSRLLFLHLDSNRLSGSIPVELGDLSSLAFLYLNDNQLSGSIPVELGDLTRLTRLYLSDNEIRGEIPEELGDLTSLTRLYLSDNQLAGSVPEELGGGSLASLYICRNMLSVTLPADLRSVARDVSTCAPAPTDLGAAGGDGQVTLSWSDPGNAGIRGYEYRVCDVGGTNCGAWTSIPGSVASTVSYVAEGLENGREYLFQLRAVNGWGSGMSAEVAGSPNEAPVAEAGDDQEVSEGAEVTLDGSGSSDPEGEELSYEWTKTSGPEVTLSSAAVESPTFTAPVQLVSNAVFKFSLVVTDARGLASPADPVTVTVTAGENDAPTANAGDNQEVSEGAEVTLDGSGSSDPEGETLTYAWAKTSGPEVTLSSAAVESPTFTAPVQLVSNAVFKFSLVVTDARGLASPADPVTVTVTAGENDAPTANAGDNQEVSEGAEVTLDGSGSSDPEGETLTYAWAKTSGPDVTLSSAAVESPTFTAPVQLVSDAVFKFSLVVTDARGLASPADPVTVTVTAGENDAPTANAGDNQTVTEGAVVTLDGSGSSDPEGETLSYEWTKTSGPEVTLSSAAAQSPTFTAPTQLVSNAVFKFSLVVTDARGLASPADPVTVTVTAGENDAPTANAGDNQEVTEGAVVTLDGSGSSDPEGETLSYEWTKTSGPEVTLSSAAAQSPTFTAPTQLVSNAVFKFSLVVTDARGLASPADPVTVTVTAGENDAPTANAGDNQEVTEGAVVTLDGSGSSDPEGETLSYEWTKTSGPEVTLSSAAAQSPTFTAPTQLVSNAVFKFSLVVTDARGLASPADPVTVTVTAGENDAPTANAGDNQEVTEGAVVTLDGSGSSDPEGETLSYEWTKTSGPEVTLSSAAVESPTFTAPTQLVSDAVFKFSLVVTDARGLASPADTVTVTVTAGENDAPTANAGDNQTVTEGAVVTLDGSGSSDPEGETLSYEWTKTSGPEVTLSSAAAQSPTFTAPTQLVSNAVFKFSLVVTDARGLASPADTVTVTVTKAPELVLSKTSMSVRDNGSSDSLSVRLSKQPTGTVTVAVGFLPAGHPLWGGGVENDATLSTSSLTFTTSNWNTDQTVTVTGLDDGGSSAQTAHFILDPSGADYDNAATVTVFVTVSRNEAPAADAGDNQTVSEGAVVTLDGSGSSDPEGETLTYAWSGPDDVTLSSAAAQSPTFTAPAQLVSDAVFKFSLVVTDARGLASPADTVTVTVTAGPNDAPEPDPGDDQTVTEGATVRLDGSGSSDPEGEGLSYEWSGPDEVTLSSDAAQRPTFTAPVQLVSDAALVFSLVVTDARGLASSADTVTVTVTAGVNDAPTANAGDNQTVTEGATVRLDGSGSSDPEGETLSYAWSGPDDVTLSSATAQRPTFTAPVQLVSDAALVFSLVVTDARGLASSPDTVTITVTKAPELVLSKTSMSVRDNGSSDSLSVRLSKQPTGTVTVTVGFVDATENDATLSTSSLTFTTSTWNTDQTVTVTGLNDGGSSPQTAPFILDPSGADYDNAATVTVSVTVSRYVPVVLSATDLTVAEGSSVTFQVKLATQPTGTVTIAIQKSNSDITVQPTSLTFTTSTWDTNQTVTVNGVDDSNNADETATITVNPSGAGLASRTVSVTITGGTLIVIGFGGRVTSEDFLTLDAAGNNNPEGLYANATTFFVNDWLDKRIYAYNRTTKARDSGKDIDYSDEGVSIARGLWSDGTTLWLVVAHPVDKLMAFTLSTGARDSSKDINLASGHGNPWGVWGDGTTVWVSEGWTEDRSYPPNWEPEDPVLRPTYTYATGEIYAYTLATGARDSSKDITSLTDTASSYPGNIYDNIAIWSDGTTLWVGSRDDHKLVAHVLATGARDSSKDITLSGGNRFSGALWGDNDYIWIASAPGIYAHSLQAEVTIRPEFGDRVTSEDFLTLDAAGNNNPEGLYANATTFFVNDWLDKRIYAYNRTTKARDSGKDIDYSDEGVSIARGLWSDGTTLWLVVAHPVDKLMAFTLSTGARDSSKDINLASGHGNPWGVWGDGTTVWVSEGWTEDINYPYPPPEDSFSTRVPNPDDVTYTYATGKIYAYTLATGARDSSKDITSLTDTASSYPGNIYDNIAIWSDGTTLWVGSRDDHKLVAHVLATGARDSSKDITLSGGNRFSGALWGDNDYIWIASAPGIYAHSLQAEVTHRPSRGPDGN